MKNQLAAAFRQSFDQAGTIVEDIPEDKFAVLADTSNKCPAWVIGHLTVGANYAAQLLGGGVELPESYNELFSPQAEPSPDPSKYPSKAELMQQFAAAHEATEEVFAKATDEHLAAELPMPEYRDFWPTIADGVFYMMALHEPYHLGQLTQWRKAIGIGAAKSIY